MERPRTVPTDAGLTAISLFCGCGGLDLGANRAGLRVVWATDSQPEVANAIASLLPETEFDLWDVRKLRSYPQADVVLGGYPCQPFSVGGARKPHSDSRARLFEDFARVVAWVQPKYFVAENVAGLRMLGASQWLAEQTAIFQTLGKYGYHVSVDLLDAADYGVPQHRKRLFLVGVRKDLRRVYLFPDRTHAAPGTEGDYKEWVSHGDALAAASLPKWPYGEFHDRPNDPDNGFSWWYMSRNRKAPWAAPAATVLANERQVALHPASPVMEFVSRDPDNTTRQVWRFTSRYEHLAGHKERPILSRPRRLSWRECAILQSFPVDFEPTGSLSQKYEQIGNAVPPALAEAVIRPLADGSGLVRITNLRNLERLALGLPLRGPRATDR